ncbi:MAG: TonB-dependent receptor [Bacteroidales bacterium]|nr:TonB-dependent receptor [Bacteroidales bacterium]
MKKVLLFALAALISTMAFAQSRVTGTVTSKEDGGPIPGVNVMVKGTRTGSFTDENGKYSINAPANATLVFTSVGYTTLEVPVNGRSVVNAVMASDAIGLDETIVVAYGTAKKGSYSGSAAVVKQDAIKDVPVVSFEQALAGKAAGVQAMSYSGQPGSEVEISVRGYGSLNASNKPLYVIDGVPATSGDWGTGNISISAMNYLNPSDIESITILKDAAAASLYGSRASNGVILITTKKGKEGDLVSTFKANASVSYFSYKKHMEMVNDAQNEALQRMSFRNYAEANPSAWSSYGSVDAYVQSMLDVNYPAFDYDKYIYKDWEKALFQKGISQNYEYSISGGNDKGKIYASVAYTDQHGVVKIDYLRRFSATVNGEAKLNKWLKLGGIIQYSWQYQTGHQDGWSSKDNPMFIWKAVMIDRWPYAYKATGELYEEEFSTRFNTINPVGQYKHQINDATQHRVILKGWAEVAFTDYLKLKSTLASDYLYVHDKFNWLYGHPNFYAYGTGYASDKHRNVNKVVSSTTLNFDKMFDVHHVSAMVGWEAEREKFNGLRLGKTDFSYLGATESIMGTTLDEGYAWSYEESLLSLLSSASYDFNSKYYLTGTFRRDGSSRLAPNTRWGNFWSVSGTWRFSKEKFLEFPWLNDGKIRGSYGTSGTLPSDLFGYMSVYDYGYYGSDGASYPGNIANTDLTWEKNKNWNIGLDATLFDRYTLSVEYFNRKTTDLLLDASVASTTGFGSTLMNKGSMVNRGWEVSVNVDIIKKQDMELSVGANWTRVHNEILKLSTDDEAMVDPNWGWFYWKKGYNYYQWYTRTYLGINKTGSDLNGVKPGWPMYARGVFYSKGETLSNDIILRDGTVVKAGEKMPYDGYDYTPSTRNNGKSMVVEGKRAMPKFFGGFNANFRWKDLSVSMAWNYKFGHYLLNSCQDNVATDGYRTFAQPIMKTQLNPWTPENQNTDVPMRYLGNNQGGYYNSSRMLVRGDFARLKNLTISYNLPRAFVQKLTLRNARVYLSGANLLTISKCEIEPELQSNGIYEYGMPALRTWSFGVEVSF